MLTRTQVFHDFPLSLQENASSLPQMRTQLLPSTSISLPPSPPPNHTAAKCTVQKLISAPSLNRRGMSIDDCTIILFYNEGTGFKIEHILVLYDQTFVTYM